MQAVATAILNLMIELAPAISTASTIAKIISTLETLIPAIVQYAKDLYPLAKYVIGLLSTNDAVTADQQDQLDAIEVKIDADYAAALADAKARAAAASQQPS